MCVVYETEKRNQTGKKETILSNDHMQGWEAEFFFFFLNRKINPTQKVWSE